MLTLLPLPAMVQSTKVDHVVGDQQPVQLGRPGQDMLV